MEFDGYLALFVFVFLFSATIIFGVYRLSVFTLLFAATIGYLYYLAMNGKISNKELFEMSLIPVGFMLAPIILVIYVFGPSFAMLFTKGISESMFEIY